MNSPTHIGLEFSAIRLKIQLSNKINEAHGKYAQHWRHST